MTSEQVTREHSEEIVEFKRIVDEKSARSEVTQARAGITSGHVWTDEFGGAGAVGSGYEYWRGADGVEHEVRTLTLAQFLSARARAFAPQTDGVEYGELGIGYVAACSSAVVFGSGTGESGRPVHFLLSLGIHPAFPFPRAHWDEAQVAILDGGYEKVASYRLAESQIHTHLDVQFETLSGGSTRRLVFRGHAQDDAGALHFLDLELIVPIRAIHQAAPSTWKRFTAWLNQKIGYDQRPVLLVADSFAHGTSASFRIDGREALSIHSIFGLLDDEATFHQIDAEALAINYAPPSVPLVASIDPLARTARYRYDADLLRADGLIRTILPKAVRRGTTSAHYTVDASGARRDADVAITQIGAALSGHDVLWPFGADDSKAATLRRELLVLDVQGADREFGFRETIYAGP